jgi:hypothetical protein
VNRWLLGLLASIYLIGLALMLTVLAGAITAWIGR